MILTMIWTSDTTFTPSPGQKAALELTYLATPLHTVTTTQQECGTRNLLQSSRYGCKEMECDVAGMRTGRDGAAVM